MMTSEAAPSLLIAGPFVLMLGAIATMPMVRASAHWWERNSSKLLVSLGLGAMVVGHYALRGWGYRGAGAGWPSVVALGEHAILGDYVPFMALMGSLYIIAGGVWLEGDIPARPWVNVAFLAAGAAMASLVGTTGASMILIRPLLQTNGGRTRVTHTVVFFTFLAANVGGCLLPIGDPPLFLGYLRGVPFFWTVGLVLPWLFVITVLLLVYYVWDRVAFAAEPATAMEAEEVAYTPPRVGGKPNLIWLAMAVATVAVVVPGQSMLGTGFVPPRFLREGILIGLTGLSLRTTPPGLRILTGFRYGPIVEVACLFLGIFVTMEPALEILRARASGLGLESPRAFFWATGGLSSLLDNAPTYLVCFEVARSLPDEGARLVHLVGGGTIDEPRLVAISLGSVFAGALTYLGNGPNLMVKAIAESRGVRMPGFFGYALYALAVLGPVFALVAILFVG